MKVKLNSAEIEDQVLHGTMLFAASLPPPLSFQRKEAKLMPIREELFAAMQLIKGYCRSRDECQVITQAATKDCCPFFTQFGARWCALQNDPPCVWPDTLFYTPGSTDVLT